MKNTTKNECHYCYKKYTKWNEKINEKLYNWASIIEPETLEQALLTSSMGIIYPHIALMPDAHLGKGSTVGSVVPTKGAIVPSCIGVDIGCGMIALKTSHNINELSNLNKVGIHESISSQIPLSAGRYNKKIKEDAKEHIANLEKLASKYSFDPDRRDKNWRLQLGTLGSGNHFIEVSLDTLGNVWLFLHSGSRGVGNKIAMEYIKLAEKISEEKNIKLPTPELAYLIEGEAEFNNYINEMSWAQEFALSNREVMMERVKAAFTYHAGEFEILEKINCHHNFTQKENHFNEDLWVTRKGAISAKVGERGLIPGSMGDLSYVVTGLGDETSLNSAPHGAGRKYGRNKSRELFTFEGLNEKMEGIIWGNSKAFIDEHPEAYKPIEEVMSDAKNLVKIDCTLKQIINVKGD